MGVIWNLGKSGKSGIWENLLFLKSKGFLESGNIENIVNT